MRRVVQKIHKLRTASFIRGVALGNMGFCTASAVSEHGTREWLEMVELDLPVRNLDPVFEGTRIVHISDLHCSTTVRTEYLKRCVDRINKIGPDMILLTGDYVTYDKQGRFKDKVVKVLSELQCKMGVYACMGNHDYKQESQGKYSATPLIRALEQAGIKVLHNQAKAVTLHRHKLWLVGLGDLWCGDFQPIRAYSAVPAGAAQITLVHNPYTIEFLKSSNADVILCGHTHGAKIEVPESIQTKLASQPLFCGMFLVEGKKIYINRGLGRHGRPRFRCRPEITIFTLRQEK